MHEAPRRTFRLDRGSRDDADSAVGEELAFHLDAMAEELVEQGWTEVEARAEARRRFGDVDGTRSYCTDVQARRGRGERRGGAMDQVRQDLAYTVRTIRRAPGYAALVVLTLAFGIAANTTVFSVMNPYFFRALPFGDAEELVHVTQVNPVTGWHMDRFSLPIHQDWRERSRAFEELGAYTYRAANVTGPEGPEMVTSSVVTANMFRVLRADAALGRTFAPDEEGPGAEPVAVLAHGFWQRRYVGDPGILGRPIDVDGVAHTVVGVMPPDFTFPFGGVAFWTPVSQGVAEAPRGVAPYLLVGRMNEGWTREEVAAELTGIQAELGALHPDADGRWSGVTVLPMRQALNFAWDILSLTFTLFLGAVLFVLAIACVNVASLTLARAGSRAREMSVRVALGAGRGRVVRQLLTESLVLALLGGALGVALAWMLTGIVGPVIPEDLYRVGNVEVDRTVLAFSLLVTLATPLLFGLAPALAATRRDLVGGLKAGAGGTGRRGRASGRSALVVAQVAIAVVLITGAGLMVRSFAAVREVDIGFDAERTLYATVQPPTSRYALGEVGPYVERAVQAIEALPGVASASAVLHMPLNNETSTVQFGVPGSVAAPGEGWPLAIANRPHPGYFRTMEIPLLAGRDFLASDDATAPPVAIVNRALATRLWPDEDAVGQRLMVGSPENATEVTVVGVVAGVRHAELVGAGAEGPEVYRPAAQAPYRRHFLVVRTDGDPAALVGSVREALLEVDPDTPVTVAPVSSIVRQSLLQWSLGSAFLGAFGLGALLLATLGIYGLIAFTVSRGRRDMGVRLALGASRGEVRWQVVRGALRLAGSGVALGVVAAVALGRLASAALYGVAPTDPVTLGVVIVLFPAVAALAALLPAERASRTDPVVVMRTE